MNGSSLLNRQREIDLLTDAWGLASGGRSQLVIVWGRRRVGKTFLLSHFAKDKPALFFPATQQAEGVELARLMESIRRDLGSDAADRTGGAFPSWEGALRFLAASARDAPLLVILDEVPYLTSSTKGFASIVQTVWDHLRRGTKLMLVLMGSAVGTMESMLGPGGALRGRATLAHRLDPLDIRAAKAFLPRLGPRELFEAYAACGGYPLHLKAWDSSVGTNANLMRLAAHAGGLLLDDASGILSEELPDVGGYPRILAAIGRGRTRTSEIASDAGQRIEHPLDVLVRAGFVRRSLPVGAPRRARPMYEIADPYLAFWFSVLYSELAHIEAGQGRAVLARRREEWNRHLSWVFEETAREHAIRLVAAGGLPESLVIGRWWTSAGLPCEVDVLGLRGNRSHLLGEAKWSSNPLGRRDLRDLVAKAERVPTLADDALFVLWGLEGVDDEVGDAEALALDLEAMLLD